jgi:hypothetical protein
MVQWVTHGNTSSPGGLIDIVLKEYHGQFERQLRERHEQQNPSQPMPESWKYSYENLVDDYFAGLCMLLAALCAPSFTALFGMKKEGATGAALHIAEVGEVFILGISRAVNQLKPSVLLRKILRDAGENE